MSAVPTKAPKVAGLMSALEAALADVPLETLEAERLELGRLYESAADEAFPCDVLRDESWDMPAALAARIERLSLLSILAALALQVKRAAELQ